MLWHLEKRFRILREPMDLATPNEMWATMIACVALHNFIRVKNAAVDVPFSQEVIEEENNVFSNINEHDLPEFDNEAKAYRDEIAKAMWTDYTANH